MLQAADGSMGDDRLRVVGIVRTGVGALDRQAAWMSLPDVAYLAALDGQAHELMIRFDRGADLERTTAAIRSAIEGTPGPKLVVRTWQELAPELHKLIGLSKLSMLFLYGIVYLIAALGILNAQRMTALERKREMAVMMAVGVTPMRLGAMILAEAALLCAFGATAGILVGALVTWYHAHAGLDLAAMGSQGFSYAGVSFQSRIHFVLRPTMVLWPAVAVVVVGVLCGLWPALASVRLRLAGAIGGTSHARPQAGLAQPVEKPDPNWHLDDRDHVELRVAVDDLRDLGRNLREDAGWGGEERGRQRARACQGLAQGQGWRPVGGRAGTGGGAGTGVARRARRDPSRDRARSAELVPWRGSSSTGGRRAQGTGHAARSRALRGPG
jgi:hypothetical protein